MRLSAVMARRTWRVTAMLVLSVFMAMRREVGIDLLPV
jgi:hypothetical protein